MHLQPGVRIYVGDQWGFGFKTPSFRFAHIVDTWRYSVYREDEGGLQHLRSAGELLLSDTHYVPVSEQRYARIRADRWRVHPDPLGWHVIYDQDAAVTSVGLDGSGLWSQSLTIGRERKTDGLHVYVPVDASSGTRDDPATLAP